jgi:NAD(P)-dependent dehydrogenase (short-subunit alcohol dehydrogenase family)
MRLRDRVAIVTGGGTGIGAGIARCLAREGAALTLAQRRVALAEELAEELRGAGARARAAPVDVSRRSDAAALVADTVAAFGRVDILVNNAAITGPAALGAFLDETDDHWSAVLAVNLTGAFYCAQEAARQMVRQGDGGVIVNISSVASPAAQEHAAAYCASKAGMDALTRVMAIELASHGIRVVSVAPGDVYTDASSGITEEARAGGASGRFVRYTPQGRRGTAAEIGDVVAFVASDEAGFVTGCNWRVDGGFLSY